MSATTRYIVADPVRAAAICRTCPVITQCETWLAGQPHFEGVAAGRARYSPHITITDKCGTVYGWRHHMHHGQPPCADCQHAATRAWTARYGLRPPGGKARQKETTRRRRRVARLLSRGRTDQQIAAILRADIRTIRRDMKLLAAGEAAASEREAG
jgi:hypothetical protein